MTICTISRRKSPPISIIGTPEFQQINLTISQREEFMISKRTIPVGFSNPTKVEAVSPNPE